MIDPFGRHISYLRVSVTDRCDFRCVYCMAEDMTFLPKAEVLSLEELERLCSAFVRRGVKKLRLTGGEPLVRKNVMSLIRGLGRHLDSGALEELTLTTNGSQLAKYAKELAAVGVKRLNVSMDTLDKDKFRELTRWGDLDQVMRGIDAAQDAGLHIKINAVALRGVNDMEFDELIRWSHGRGMDLTLIEVMPMGEIGDAARLDQYLPLSLARAEIAKHFTLTETDYRTGGPARYFKVEETGGRLGFITPLTHNFCESCNRVRLTCTGTLYMCLGQEDAADLRAPLRASESDELLDQAITEAIARKPKGHDFIIDRRHIGPGRAAPHERDRRLTGRLSLRSCLRIRRLDLRPPHRLAVRDVHGAGEDHRRADEGPDVGRLEEQEVAQKRVPDQRQEADRLQQRDVGELVAALLADMAQRAGRRRPRRTTGDRPSSASARTRWQAARRRPRSRCSARSRWCWPNRCAPAPWRSGWRPRRSASRPGCR